MAFNKKKWVNVPDPSNLPDVPEGQDALARFDAENMNRIEEGIKETDGNLMSHLNNKKNPHSVTAAQVGAIAKTTYLDGKDVLEVDIDGSYYCTNSKNVPTENNKSGYLTVIRISDTYRVIYWKTNNTYSEYVNVLHDGVWIGWTEFLTNKGGTINGDISVHTTLLPALVLKTDLGLTQIFKNASSTDDFGLVLRDCDSPDFANSNTQLELCHKNAKTNKNNSLILRHLVNGVESAWRIFGEHNKPSGTYIGNCAENDTPSRRQVRIGGTGKLLYITNFSTSSYCRHGFISDIGGVFFYIPTDSNIWNRDYVSIAGTELISFENGILNINTEHSGVNRLGVEYTYQVL